MLHDDCTHRLAREAAMYKMHGLTHHTLKSASVQTQDFAGRLGANQQFTLNKDHVSAAADAVRDTSWSSILSPPDFPSVRIWKLAVIEGIATFFQTFLSAALSMGLIPIAATTSLGPVTPVAFAAVFQIFNIALFVYAAGPVTGAHLNPLITLATFCAKLATLPRAILYIVFQCAGAVFGAFVFRSSIRASAQDLTVIPGCYADPTIVTPGRA